MLLRTLTFTGLCAGLLLSANAFALSLGDLSQSDATGGLKDALTQGAQVAVKQLGVPGGFSNNQDVRIELPGNLGKVAKKMKQFGMGAQVDQLETSMNQAAEAAVPQAQALLVDAVKKMSVEDAKQVLTGGDDSVTQFFVGKTREPLGVKFLPIVTRATEKVSLAERYNDVAGKALAMGLVKKEDANVQQYVTAKALDGLFLMIGEEERKIRKDPVATGSAILKKVFGALK